MTIHLVGSGPQAEGLDPVWDSFVACAKRRSGGDEPRPIAVCVLHLPSDEGDPADWLGGYTDPILARWPEARFQLVVLRPSASFLAAHNGVAPETTGNEPANEEPAQGNDHAFPADLNHYAGLIVGGGWTPGYLDSLAPNRDQIARAVRQDVPYLGFSAGASIASRHALIGGSHVDGIQVQQEFAAEDLHDLTVTDGLALISTLVQVHTDAWSNEGIVISALERNLAGHAVCIDEGTALVVDQVSGHTSRLGRGRLRWLSKESHGVLVRTEEPARTEPAADPATAAAAPTQPHPPRPVAPAGGATS